MAAGFKRWTPGLLRHCMYIPLACGRWNCAIPSTISFPPQSLGELRCTSSMGLQYPSLSQLFQSTSTSSFLVSCRQEHASLMNFQPARRRLRGMQGLFHYRLTGVYYHSNRPQPREHHEARLMVGMLAKVARMCGPLPISMHLQCIQNNVVQVT